MSVTKVRQYPIDPADGVWDFVIAGDPTVYGLNETMGSLATRIDQAGLGKKYKKTGVLPTDWIELAGSGGSEPPFAIADITNLQSTLDGKATASHNHSADAIASGTLDVARLPVATTALRGAQRVDHDGAGDPQALTATGHLLDADPHPQYALDAEKGQASGLATLDGSTKLTASQLPLGSSASTACAGDDARLSDARTPVAHSHAAADVTSGTLGIARIPLGSTSSTVCVGNDSRLSDARTPVAHTHPASDIASGTVATARLGSGTADSTKFLRGDQTWAAPSGGSDPWTYLKVTGSDFTTTSATAVDITGLGFTPAANTDYEFYGFLLIRTATATVNPRVGLAWATGGTDGVAMIYEAQTATGAPINAAGNINASLLVAVGGLPNTTQSWPVGIEGTFRAGGSPSGNVRLQLASETAGTTVRAVIGSFLRYRII